VVDVHRSGRVLGTSATAEVPGVKEVPRAVARESERVWQRTGTPRGEKNEQESTGRRKKRTGT
jgi:hypothetical protein